jgi:hypothetical protein
VICGMRPSTSLIIAAQRALSLLTHRPSDINCRWIQAKRADRRLKGLRINGDVLAGVRVAGKVTAVFEHIEPRTDGLPSWLDLTVPDDRFVASSLLLQSAHPGSALYVATGDINLQTKLTAVGLPFIELPATT